MAKEIRKGLWGDNEVWETGIMGSHRIGTVEKDVFGQTIARDVEGNELGRYSDLGFSTAQEKAFAAIAGAPDPSENPGYVPNYTENFGSHSIYGNPGCCLPLLVFLATCTMIIF